MLLSSPINGTLRGHQFLHKHAVPTSSALGGIYFNPARAPTLAGHVNIGSMASNIGRTAHAHIHVITAGRAEIYSAMEHNFRCQHGAACYNDIDIESKENV